MGDHYDKVTEDQDPIKRIASKIPGFGGYIERENRRNADKLLRESTADRFQGLWKRITEIQKDLAGQSNLEFLDDLENAAMKVQTFIDKISTASYGQSSFFDAVKIDEEELAALYNFDLALLSSSDEVERAVDNVNTSIGEEGLPAAVSHLVTVSRELVSAFEQRSEAIMASAAE
jgi:hypothetical protein